LLVVVGILALLSAAIASAAGVSLEEADLTAYGTAYEINRGPGGALYLSDYDALEIWQIDTSGAYTLYQVFETVLDARPDDAGNVWFTDGAVTFGRVTVPTGTVTTWQVPELHNLWGLAFDGAGRVWMTEFFGAASKLYRFDPGVTELCTYTLPGSSYSYYVLHDEGQLWLGNWSLDRIYRIDIVSNQATWWQIGDSSARPTGLGLDQDDNLWWADPGLGALIRLEPGLDRMTSYGLPLGTTPRVLETSPEGVWYTEDSAGTVGLLDPAVAAGTTTTLTTGSGSVVSECSIWGPGTTSLASISTDSLIWASGTVTTVVDGGGWTVYELATGASPYGIADAGAYLWASDQGRQKLLRLSAATPAVDVEKYTNGLDADSPPGPTITVGDPVTWTYRVENKGNVDLTNVTVADDNGTPAIPADDYLCAIGNLAAGAVDDTTCSQSGTAVAGPYANVATVTADADTTQVSDTDASHYLGQESNTYTYIFLPLVLRNMTP
jgi:streptogramin lyase